MEFEEESVVGNNVSYNQSEPSRAIIHLDVNCFYASVEQARLYPGFISRYFD